MQILYFSLTGATEKAAKQISDLTGAKITKVKSNSVYPIDDFDQMKKIATKEQQDGVLPSILNPIEIEKDDIVFIGYPVWNQQLPPVIASIFDQVDFSGKQLIGFITSGSTQYEEIEPEFKKIAKSGEILKGFRANDGNEIINQLQKLDLIK